jgi:diguanylate cyclase (GGDEF)-like protein/PAS domain S-box-containing protein
LGDEIYTQTSFEDITERNKVEEALRVSEERFRLLSEAAFEAIVIHEEGVLLNANDQYFKMFGYEPGEALGKEMISVTFVPEVLEFVKKQVATGSMGPYETIGLRKDGTRLPIEIRVRKMDYKGRIVRFGAIRDITERKQAEDKLRKSEQRYRELSIIDDLSQLYNSRHFYAQLEIEIERSNRYGQPLTLLLLDLDRFKKFNDKYGHVEGDYVLSQLGQIIKRCLRDPDSAYRYGGEEFTIILPMTTSNEGIVTAKRIQTELRKETFSPTLDQNINMTVSIGLAQYEPTEEMKTFVQRVDKLMYQAKKDGRDRICPDRIRHERSVIG